MCDPACPTSLSKAAHPPLLRWLCFNHIREALECTRKLLLTGVAVRIMPGSLMQLMVALMVMVLYIAAILVCRPYKAPQHNIIAVALYSMLAVTFVCGLLLKVKDGFENSGKYEDGYTASSITGVLICSVVVVLVSGLGGIFYDLRRVINEPLFHFDKGGGIVALPPLAPHLNFDLFLQEIMCFDHARRGRASDKDCRIFLR